MSKPLPLVLIKYRHLMSQLIGQMRQLRTPNLLYLGKGQILASLDLGYQLAIDAQCSKSLCRALQPCPIDLALTAIYSLILRDHSSPTSVLIGADDLVHAMNLLFINKSGTLCAIDARALVHERIRAALDRNESHFANLLSHTSAVGKRGERVALEHGKAARDCIICLDEEGGAMPIADGEQTSLAEQMVSCALDDLLTWEEVLRVQLLLIDAPKHLPQILQGIDSIWTFNPFAHLIFKMGSDFKAADWKELQSQLTLTQRRAWSLPNPRSIEKSMPKCGAIWITPSGI